ncbi:helix-hairpin-helix domain-containing protein [uncultured Maritimibacter sp.]|uniref:helix-hairpin-helix domain-containing protein n=1 Tax=uncultured Maritimibacter sp. TaxID=991866 RepID=UPI0026396766|nr:helix-hairpin-helix domain-containing protein [uncultured Maritimibacter sp.]
MHELSSIPGIGPAMLSQLAGIGITDVEALAQADVMLLTTVRGISPERAEAFRAEARMILAVDELATKVVGSDVVEVAQDAPTDAPDSTVVDFRPVGTGDPDGKSKPGSKKKSVEQKKPKAEAAEEAEAPTEKARKARHKALKANVKLAEAKLARQKKKLKKAKKALRAAK